MFATRSFLCFSATAFLFSFAATADAALAASASSTGHAVPSSSEEEKRYNKMIEGWATKEEVRLCLEENFGSSPEKLIVQWATSKRENEAPAELRFLPDTFANAKKQAKEGAAPPTYTKKFTFVQWLEISRALALEEPNHPSAMNFLTEDDARAEWEKFPVVPERRYNDLVGGKWVTREDIQSFYQSLGGALTPEKWIVQWATSKRENEAPAELRFLPDTFANKANAKKPAKAGAAPPTYTKKFTFVQWLEIVRALALEEPDHPSARNFSTEVDARAEWEKFPVVPNANPKAVVPPAQERGFLAPDALKKEAEESETAALAFRDAYRHNIESGSKGWIMRFQEAGENGTANKWTDFGRAANWMGVSRGVSPFKFHISIDPKKVEQGGAEIWKVLDKYPNIVREAKTWASGAQAQYGKQFCLRFHSSATGQEVQEIFDKIEQGLTNAGVGIDDTGGVNTWPENVARGKYDRIVPGAKKYPEGFGRFAYRNESWMQGQLDENGLEWIAYEKSKNMKLIAEGVLETLREGLRIFTKKHWDSLSKEDWYNPVLDADPFKEIVLRL